MSAADHTVRHYKRKLRELSTDDGSKAVLKTSSLVFTAFSRADHYREAKKEYRREKSTLKAKKKERKYLTESNKKFLTSESNAFHATKSTFRKRKKAFKRSKKSAVAKLRFKRRKKAFKAEKKTFKKTKRTVRAANKTLKKRVRNARRIKNLKKPQFTTGAAAAYWNKLQSSVSENNDTAKAITTAANAASSLYKKNKSFELERAEKQERKLEKKSNKFQAKIKEKQYSNAHSGSKTGTQSKDTATKKNTANSGSGKTSTQNAKSNSGSKNPDKKTVNQPKQPKRYGTVYNRKSKTSGTNKKPHYKWQRLRKKYGYDENKPIEENVKEVVKNIFKRVGHAATVAAGKALLALIPIAVFLICVNLVIMGIASIFENSSFIIGTYTAKDNDLSDAVYEYTNIAMNFNNSILLCKNKNKCKDGLLALHAINKKSDIKTIPTKFEYSGDKFSCSLGEYDFDPYVLWSFMCAYYYDFEESEQAKKDGKTYTPDYWELDDNGEKILQTLFDTEYEFRWDYNDQSHWENLPEWISYPDEPKVYFSIYSSFYSDRIQLYQAPSEIWNFAKAGWIGFNSDTLEILNANDKNAQTGYFLMDQRWTYSGIGNVSGGTLPQFYYHDEDYNYFWGDCNPRKGFGWSGGEQIYFCVSPGDTYDFTGGNLTNKCLVTFIKEKQWVTDITLSYVVEQKCSFAEAARSILGSMDSYSSDRIAYFNILIGDEDDLGTLRGNHQMLQCPLKDKTMKDLLDEDRIYNGYGFDVKNWNETHCSIENGMHNGIDISCATYDEIVTPMDGTVKEITDNRIVIESKVKFWYEKDKKHSVKITIDNVRSSGISVGDEVKKGDVIGNPAAKHMCDGLNNIKAENVYIHLKIEIYYPKSRWTVVDPRILIG